MSILDEFVCELSSKGQKHYVKEPFVYSCGFLACKRCLGKIAGKNSMFNCNQCGDVHAINQMLFQQSIDLQDRFEGVIKNFQSNFYKSIDKLRDKNSNLFSKIESEIERKANELIDNIKTSKELLIQECVKLKNDASNELIEIEQIISNNDFNEDKIELIDSKIKQFESNNEINFVENRDIQINIGMIRKLKSDETKQTNVIKSQPLSGNGPINLNQDLKSLVTGPFDINSRNGVPFNSPVVNPMQFQHTKKFGIDFQQLDDQNMNKPAAPLAVSEPMNIDNNDGLAQALHRRLSSKLSSTAEMKSITINKKEYEIVDRISHGSFGLVYKVKNSKNKNYMVKSIKKTKNVNLLIDNLNELIKLSEKESNHNPMLKICSFDEKPNDLIYIRMEVFESSLRWVFNEVTKLTDENYHRFNQCLITSCYIIRALRYMDIYQIIHGNLKPESFVIVQDAKYPWKYNIKLVDFGKLPLFDMQAMQETNKNAFFEFAYISPTYNENSMSKADDIWSCGIMLYELVYSRIPLEMENQKSLKIFLNSNNSISLPQPQDEIYKYLLELVDLCLKRDPKHRTSAMNLCLQTIAVLKKLTQIVDQNTLNALENLLKIN